MSYYNLLFNYSVTGLQVHASDADTGLLAEVSYTRIYGFNNESLRIDNKNGTITVQSNKHGFDREFAGGNIPIHIVQI